MPSFVERLVGASLRLSHTSSGVYSSARRWQWTTVLYRSPGLMCDRLSRLVAMLGSGSSLLVHLSERGGRVNPRARRRIASRIFGCREVTMTRPEDRRRSPRVGIELPLKLTTDDTSHAAIVLDASDHGVVVLSPGPYPVGRPVVLSSGARWSASARVVWCQSSRISIPRITKSWSSVFRAGLEFSEPQLTFRQRQQDRQE